MIPIDKCNLLSKEQLLMFRPWLFCYVWGLRRAAATGGAWTTVGISIERYLSVRHHIKTKRIHRFYTIPTVIGSTLINIPWFFQFKVSENDRAGSDLNVQLTEFGLSEASQLGYARFVLRFILPLLALIVFNSLIYKQIRSLQETDSIPQRYQK